MSKLRKLSRRKISFIILISILFIFICLFNTLLVRGKANKNNDYQYYRSIKVKSGDTLWDLAEIYTKNRNTINNQKFINEVKLINNLSDDTIYSDVYLIIPYYEKINDLL